jgi:hypothetical protein
MTEQPGFEMVAVESSNVEAVGFVEVSQGCERDTDGDGNCHIHPQGCPMKKGILAVKFKGGKTYRYKDVPQMFFDKLMSENTAAKSGDKTASVGRVMQIVTKAPDMFQILDVDGKPYQGRKAAQ